MVIRYSRWLNNLWFLLALIFIMILLVLVDVTGKLRFAAGSVVVWVGIACLVLLMSLVFLEPGMLFGRRKITGEQMIQMIGERAGNGEGWALIRISSVPCEVYDRLSQILKHHGEMEIALYTATNRSTDWEQLTEQIERLYLSRPISNTVFGVIEAGWSWQKDVVILAKLQSSAGEEAFKSWPWPKLELRLEPPENNLVVFEANWNWLDCRDSDGLKQTWKIYETPKGMIWLMKKLEKELKQAKIVTWYVGSEKDWHSLDINSIRDYLAKRSNSPFRKFSWDGLRRWFRSANKLAIAVGFIGYMLSPFSPYNDLIVNVLPSFILASITVHFINVSLTTAMLFYYIGSNVLGILLLMWAVERLSLDFATRLSKLQKIVIATYIVGITLMMSLLDVESAIQKIYQFIGQ